MIAVIIASGQSLNKHDVDMVKAARDSGFIDTVIAVSNVGIDLAPWADALVSHDSIWWAHNLCAREFSGRKFCRTHWRGTEQFIPKPKTGCNSGYMAMQVAKNVFKANRLILLGFDMHGTHYFGKHKEGLRNTSPDRFIEHIGQFDLWDGGEVINCTPSSALKKFPFEPLENVLNSLRAH